jgi:hypothetical protein
MRTQELLPVLFQMGAAALRGIWVYSILAIFMGLLLVLVPLITLVGVRAGDHYGLPQLLSQRLEQLDGSSSEKSKSDTSEVESLALSFIIAVVAFMFLRRRRPRGEYGGFGQLPYHF